MKRWLLSISLVISTFMAPLAPVVAHAQGQRVPAIVTKDVDGDTIKVRMPDGHEETIRMLLIDTPETVDPDKPVEPYGPQASAFAKKELPVGKRVWLEEGAPGHQRDKYGRLLAYVYISPSDMYNEDVVRQGLARVAYIYRPNTQHLAALEKDEAYARAHHLGIWKIPGYVTPEGYNLAAAKAYLSASTGKSKSAPSHSFVRTGGLTVVSSRLSVARGDEASVTIQTSPGTRGTITVQYKSGPSHAHGLEPQVADHQGRITWTWVVGTHTTPGNWPVIISAGGRTIQLTLHVTD